MQPGETRCALSSPLKPRVPTSGELLPFRRALQVSNTDFGPYDQRHRDKNFKARPCDVLMDGGNSWWKFHRYSHIPFETEDLQYKGVSTKGSLSDFLIQSESKRCQAPRRRYPACNHLAILRLQEPSPSSISKRTLSWHRQTPSKWSGHPAACERLKVTASG